MIPVSCRPANPSECGHAQHQTAIGKAVRRLRQRRGWSQEKLAELSELHWTYSGGTSGKAKHISANVGKIARALKITVEKMSGDS